MCDVVICEPLGSIPPGTGWWRPPADDADIREVLRANALKMLDLPDELPAR